MIHLKGPVWKINQDGKMRVSEENCFFILVIKKIYKGCFGSCEDNEKIDLRKIFKFVIDEFIFYINLFINILLVLSIVFRLYF